MNVLTASSGEPCRPRGSWGRRVRQSRLVHGVVGDRVEEADVPLVTALDGRHPDRLAVVVLHGVGDVDGLRLRLGLIDLVAERLLDVLAERDRRGSLATVMVPPVSLTICRWSLIVSSAPSMVRPDTVIVVPVIESGGRRGLSTSSRLSSVMMSVFRSVNSAASAGSS